MGEHTVDDQLCNLSGPDLVTKLAQSWLAVYASITKTQLECKLPVFGLAFVPMDLVWNILFPTMFCN